MSLLGEDEGRAKVANGRQAQKVSVALLALGHNRRRGLGALSVRLFSVLEGGLVSVGWYVTGKGKNKVTTSGEWETTSLQRCGSFSGMVLRGNVATDRIKRRGWIFN